jgi:hypothetical protein
VDNADKLISAFSQWGHNVHLPQRTIRRLPATLREIIYKELPKRDKIFDYVERDIANSDNLKCAIAQNDVWLYPDKEKEYLKIGTLFPYWDRGLRSLCKDEIAIDHIKSFLFFASQYVGRSKMINVLGAIALTYHRSCDFRGHSMSRRTVGEIKNGFYACSFEDVFDSTLLPMHVTGKERQLHAWCRLLNALDPYINRLLFNYIKAVGLEEKGFDEEAIVALDNSVDVIVQLIRERQRGIMGNRIGILEAKLRLSKSDISTLENLYQLRCCFGAHPSLSNWWDFSELYGDVFDRYFFTVKKLIYKAAYFEAANRIVERRPDKWSEWFKQNAMMLWDAVWYHKIPPA